MENRFLSLLDAFEKGRKALAAYAILLVLLTAVSFRFSEPILAGLTAHLLHRRLVAFDPSEPFLGLLTLSLYCGFALSLPAGAWMVWRGALAARFPGMRRLGSIVIVAATLLFAAGVFLGYFLLLPAGIRFLVGFESGEVKALLSARRFIGFCGTMLLALGLCFQAPLVSYLLARAGWLKPSFFRKNWRYAILGCVVVAAIITPTPDVYNMTLMSLPLLGLYFASFAIVAVAGKRKEGDLPRR